MRIKKLETYADKIKNKQKTMKTTTTITKENEMKNHSNRYAIFFLCFFHSLSKREQNKVCIKSIEINC